MSEAAVRIAEDSIDAPTIPANPEAQAEVASGPLDEISHRKAPTKVRCKECGKTFEGPRMKQKLGSHRFKAHGGEKTASAANVAAQPVNALREAADFIDHFRSLSPALQALVKESL